LSPPKRKRKSKHRGRAKPEKCNFSYNASLMELRVGFGDIKKVISKLIPPSSGANGSTSALAPDSALATLRANWMNGMATGDQKSIAKALVKLNLTSESAGRLAAATGVDGNLLANAPTSRRKCFRRRSYRIPGNSGITLTSIATGRWAVLPENRHRFSRCRWWFHPGTEAELPPGALAQPQGPEIVNWRQSWAAGFVSSRF
jgi:hypothetical protein